MHRFMSHLDELAGLDIVLVRAPQPRASVVQAPELRRDFGALLLRLKGRRAVAPGKGVGGRNGIDRDATGGSIPTPASEVEGRP